MLDEQALRRPEFDEANSCPITLGDGQEWWFPLPPGELVLLSLDGDYEDATGFGPEFDARLKAKREASEADDVPGLVRSLFGLAVAMLGRNYDLTLEDYRTLLAWRPRDEASRAMWQAIAGASDGVGPVPKHSGDTSAS